MRKKKTIEMGRLSVEQFRQAEKLPVTVVLDDVRSLYNVGSVFRCGDAFRVKDVYLCGITATPPHPEIHKTALGGEDSVAWTYFEKTEDAVTALKQQGVHVFAIEQAEGSTSLEQLGESICQKYESNAQYAIIFGNEVKGVKQQVVDMCEGCIEIPQYGTKHSLNISVTVGIVIWEFVKSLWFKR